MTAVSTNSLSGDARIDGLQYLNRWAASPITWSAPLINGNWAFGVPTGFVALPANSIVGLGEFFAEVQRIIGFTVTYVAPTTSIETAATCLHYMYGGGAITSAPGASAYSGDSTYPSGDSRYTACDVGGEAFLTLMHEGMHGLGSKETFNAENGFPVMTAPAVSVIYNTVQSYTYTVGIQDLWDNTDADSHVQSLMPYDILVLVARYGEGDGWPGDVEFTVDPATGRVYANGTGIKRAPGLGNKVFLCIPYGNAGGRKSWNFGTVSGRIYTTPMTLDTRSNAWFNLDTAGHAQRSVVSSATMPGNIVQPIVAAGLTDDWYCHDIICGSGDTDLWPNPSTQVFTGNASADNTVHFTGNFADYTCTNNGDGTITFVDGTAGRDGTTTTENIQTFIFFNATKTDADFPDSGNIILVGSLFTRTPTFYGGVVSRVGPRTVVEIRMGT